MSTIEHELKLLLSSTTLKIISEKKLPPTNFLKKYSNTKIVQVFLSDLNFKENIEVPLFTVPIDFEKLRHKVYLCEVAVGKSLFVGRKYATMFQPPDDYDSFIVEMDDDNDRSLRQGHFDVNNQTRYIEERGKGQSMYMDTSFEDGKTYTTPQKSQGIRERGKEMDEKYTAASDMNSYQSERSGHLSERSGHGSDINTYKSDRILYTNSTTAKGRESPFSRTNSPRPVEDLTHMDLDLSRMYYIIKDQSKINPLYEVEFDYDRMLDEKQKYLCEMCQQNPSIMFCLAERASFCKFCDKSIHDNEFTQRHKRYYYDHKKECTVAMCHTHFEEKLELYCKICNRSFCKDCDRNEPCYVSPDKKHDLVDFSQGCELIRNELDKMKDDLNKINETVIENIQKYQSDLKDFNSDVTKARQAIESDYQNALNMLNNIVRQKYQIYNALYVEKAVVKERMKRMVEFVENADKVEMVKEYNNFKENKSKIDVRPERIKREKIIVKGELKVFCGDEKIKDEIYVESFYRKGRYQ